MKKLFILLTSLVISCNIAYASSYNLINLEWWETATLEDVKREIKNGADVNVKGEGGFTPLVYAAIIDMKNGFLNMINHQFYMLI